MSGIKYYAPLPVVGLGLGVSSVVYAVEGVGVEVLLNKLPNTAANSLKISNKQAAQYTKEAVLLSNLVSRFTEISTQGSKFEIKTNILFKYLSFIDVFPSIVTGIAVACNDACGKPFDRRELYNFLRSSLDYEGGAVFWNKIACCLIGGLVLGNNGESISSYRRISIPYGFCSIGLFSKNSLKEIDINSNHTEKTVVDALNLCFCLDRSDFTGFDEVSSNSISKASILDDVEQLFMNIVVDKGGGYFLRPSSLSKRAMLVMAKNDFIGTEVLAEFDKKTKENSLASSYKTLILKHNLEGVYRL